MRLLLILLSFLVIHSSCAFCSLSNLRHFSEVRLKSNYGTAEKENEEPLSVLFQRAVVHQRSGDHVAALRDYHLFIKAAEQCDISPPLYAEVHVNIGAAYVKERNIEMAKHHFEKAIGYRPVGTAHVNLALLALQEGSKKAEDPAAGIAALKEAKYHCEKTIELDDSEQSKMAALKLMGDINKMLEQGKESR